MDEPLEEAYFNWLCVKVLPPRSHIYVDLLAILHRTEFTWIIPDDKNRAEEGKELREDFLRESRLLNDRDWWNAGCSVLEMLIAFANRASFQTDAPAKEWFWTFIENLELAEYRRVEYTNIRAIEQTIRAFLNRTYHDSGHGGLFPMRWPEHDERDIQLWQQFCEYVEEQHLV